MFKKTFIFILLLILVFGGIVQAGEIQVNINQNDEDEKISEERDYNFNYDKKSFNGFKANGGPVLSLIQLDINELNENIKNQNFSPFSSEMILFGGKGIFGSKKGSSFGFNGMEGRLSSVSNANTYYRKAVLKMNYGGMLYEKGLYLNSKTNTDVAFSSFIGGGNMNLDLYYEKTAANFESQIAQANSNHFTKDFFLLAPGISINQKISSFVGLNMSLKYLLSYDFGESWKTQGQILTGPMRNFHSPMLNIQMSFGF